MYEDMEANTSQITSITHMESKILTHLTLYEFMENKNG